MAISTTLTKRVMLEAFKQKMPPTMFLSSFFRTPPRNIVQTKTVVIDIKRQDEAIAVDVIRSTGGNLNNNKRFTTKEYEPPMYDEYTALFEEELLDRLPGNTEYDEIAASAHIISVITDDQIEMRDKILRSIEKQAADVLLTGTVTLINNDTIDFKQKATHSFTVSTAWSNAAADPIDDLLTATELNRKDGKLVPNMVIMGEGSFENFLKVTEVKDRVNLRRVNRADLRPPTFNELGATFQGVISVGSYQLEVWTYPQFYLVPTGFSLPNEGTLVPFIPDDKVIVISDPSKIRLDLVFAGVPALVDKVDPRIRATLGFNQVPSRVRADFHPYAHLDNKAECINAGVKSAPLCIPTQIDGWSVIDTEP